uniref:Uncharacterized protein n=1 Tax=Cacopsylla melanoneura TaxID=428564 RepID=A0A8D8TUZ9_9HEMI
MRPKEHNENPVILPHADGGKYLAERLIQVVREHDKEPLHPIQMLLIHDNDGMGESHEEVSVRDESRGGGGHGMGDFWGVVWFVFLHQNDVPKFNVLFDYLHNTM